MKKLVQQIKEYVFGFFKPKKGFSPADLYAVAVGYLGKELKNKRGSVIVNSIYNDLTGKDIGGRESTIIMDWIMKHDGYCFSIVDHPFCGDIIISPSAFESQEAILGDEKTIENLIGDVGIVGKQGQVFSFNKETGKFDNHLRVSDWISKFAGLEVNYYRIK
jgi:hypothetical protein